MKAITLTQPWATLVAIGAKRIETRSWSTTYRGPLAIHAAAGLGPVGGAKGLGEICEREPFYGTLARHGFRYGARISTGKLPLGAVVATCTLVDVVPTNLWRPVTHGNQTWQVPPGNMSQEYSFGDYTPGRYAWLLTDVKPLREPIPAKGALSLWEWEAPHVEG